MLFNSYIFVFAFLPTVWALYMVLNKQKWYSLANAVLVAGSLIFYAYNSWKFAILLIASIGINYALHRLLMKFTKNKWILLVGAMWNLGILFYVKYFDFFLENVNALLGTDFILRNIVLPLGISFYTFQQLSFVVDSYRGDTEEYSLLEYALFVCFFPQLVAGPIVLHGEMVPQFRDEQKRKFIPANFYAGIQFFSLGLAKKVLLADTFGRAVNWGYANYGGLNRMSAIFLAVSYALQIYFDFSGYCDMAMGIGKMFNIDIIQNFNSPYKANSVKEFWDRWHITLTRFFTTYVYIPLGGNRKGKWRTYLNVMIVFTLSGIWHGANWTFLLWGVMHGVLMVLERMLGSKMERIPWLIRRIYTFGFVTFAWIFFRADSVRQALSICRRILLGATGGVAPEMVQAFEGNGLNYFMNQILPDWAAPDWWKYVLAGLWLGGGLLIAMVAPNTQQWVEQRNVRFAKLMPYLIVILGIFSIFSFSGVSTFLYFNF